MDQELFKCKPAIMRAFQAAKGAHKVIAEAAAFTCVLGSACIAERWKYGNFSLFHTPLIREVARKMTTT